MHHVLIKDGKGARIGTKETTFKTGGKMAARALGCKLADLHVLGYQLPDGRKSFYWFDASANADGAAYFKKSLGEIGKLFMNCRPKLFQKGG